MCIVYAFFRGGRHNAVALWGNQPALFQPVDLLRNGRIECEFLKKIFTVRAYREIVGQ